MRPLRRAIIAGRNRRVRCISAAAFTCTIASSRSRSLVANGPLVPKPALLTRNSTSMRRSCSSSKIRARRDRIGEVLGDDARRDAVLGGQPGRQRLQVVAPARDDDQIVAVAREQPRQLQPQPRRRPRDECGFSHLLIPCQY